MELIILEQLVPQDHLLRKIDRHRLLIHPQAMRTAVQRQHRQIRRLSREVLFRMLFVGYLYGIRSERRLEEEVNYNMAYHVVVLWAESDGKAPDATT